MIYSEEEILKIKESLIEQQIKLSKELIELDEDLEIIKHASTSWVLHNRRNKIQSMLDACNCNIGIIDGGYRGSHAIYSKDTVVHAWSDGRTEEVKRVIF